MDKFITKIILFPVIFFFLYLFIFLFGIQLIGQFETGGNILLILAGVIFVANVLAFIITFIIYKIFEKFSSVITFKRWYHFTHLLYIYISGIITVIVSLEPILIKNEVILTSIDDNYKIIMIVFVVVISNYTFFNSIVINRDFHDVSKS